jgi:SAM-dependent methyltransferase
MDEPSLRQLLEDTPPHHFKRSAAWKALVQANRERRRARGESPFIAGQRDVQRALDAVPRGAVDPHRLVDAKEGLKLLCQAASLDPEARMDLAARVDAALRELAPTLVSDPVSVVVTGWPQGFGPALRRRVLQVAVDPPGPYAPAEAARLVRDIDGLVLAGSTLGVAPQLAPFTALPPVPRSQRADKGRWGRGGPWLPYGDGEGRYSLTPRHLALAQARLVGERPVLDAMCGVGGNAVAFAERGARVVAIERDPRRAEMARLNVQKRGVADRLEVVRGDAMTLVAVRGAALGPEAVLFLDPPWLDEAGAVITRWTGFLPAPLRREVARWPGPVLLKLPPAFDVHTLPGRGAPWTVRFEFGDPERGDGHVVKMLSAWSGPLASGGDRL